MEYGKSSINKHMYTPAPTSMDQRTLEKRGCKDCKSQNIRLLKSTVKQSLLETAV